MPRLLIILNRFVIGGQAVDTIPLAWYLKSDFNILIIYGEKEADEIEPLFLIKKYPGLKFKKIKCLRRTINPFVDILAFFSILFAIITFKADIVHTHGAKSGFIGRITACLAGVPVIVHTFHGHFFHSYFSKTISNLIVLTERLIGKITTCAVALSNIQKDELVQKYKVFPSAKIKIIKLGFAFKQENHGDTLRSSFRKKYGLQNTDVAVGIIGRIVPVKNHSFFVKVIKEVTTDIGSNQPAFFIVGDGDLRKQVELELQQQNIAFNNHSVTSGNRVVFTSWLTDIYKVMNGLDIVVLTSLNEGTPLSIIEAQFFKRPVVATNVGGVKDTMIDGKTGFLVTNNDITTFTKNLRLLIENKELRKQMGEQGFVFASTRFSKQKEVEETKKFYLHLLRAKGYAL